MAKPLEALFFDPESLAAHNYAGHAHHALGQFEDATREWNWVVDSARLQKIELPGPVHLDLAQVQALGLGQFRAARETLEAYLVFEPTGAWVERTQKLLDSLPQDDGAQALEDQDPDPDPDDGR